MYSSWKAKWKRRLGLGQGKDGDASAVAIQEAASYINPASGTKRPRADDLDGSSCAPAPKVQKLGVAKNLHSPSYVLSHVTAFCASVLMINSAARAVKQSGRRETLEVDDSGEWSTRVLS